MTSIVAVGKPIGAFYMYKFDGVDPADRRRDRSRRRTAARRDHRRGDRMIVGNPHPKYFGGFTNTFTLPELRAAQVPPVQPGEQRVQHDAHLRRRRRLHATTTRARDVLQSLAEARRHHRRAAHELRLHVRRATVMSSRFIEDGSFLRVGEVTLGYRLPASFAAQGAARQRAPLRLRPQPRDVHEVLAATTPT